MYGERGRHVQGQLLQGELRQDQVLPNFLSIANLSYVPKVCKDPHHFEAFYLCTTVPARRKKSSFLVQLLNFSVRYLKLRPLGTER
jgi:hypothetical protein